MELRARVIAAATALFRTEGLRFTMQEVAAALRISKKTIYTVYPSKEKLLLDMVDALFADIHREKGSLMAAPGPVEERVKAVIVALPEQYRTVDFRLLGTLDEKYPAVARRVREHLATNWEPTIALLEEGVAAGRIRPIPIPVLRQMITASIERFLADGGCGASYADTLAAMIDIIMNGIRRRNDEVQPVRRPGIHPPAERGVSGGDGAAASLTVRTDQTEDVTLNFTIEIEEEERWT